MSWTRFGCRRPGRGKEPQGVPSIWEDRLDWEMLSLRNELRPVCGPALLKVLGEIIGNSASAYSDVFSLGLSPF